MLRDKGIAMARTKIVNGSEVPLTPAEESARDAEDAAWAVSQSVRDAEAARIVSIDASISGFSHGAQTLAQLKAMDAAAFDAWWSANVTNLAQANTVLKFLARAALRRML